jgi:hypothetical protein
MENPKLDGRIELDEVLLKAKENTKNFINLLESEEAGERIETVDALSNQIKADAGNTNRKKSLFIDEMKSGLGKEIMDKKARGVKLKKITLKEKVLNFFIVLYSKF